MVGGWVMMLNRENKKKRDGNGSDIDDTNSVFQMVPLTRVG